MGEREGGAGSAGAWTPSRAGRLAARAGSTRGEATPCNESAQFLCRVRVVTAGRSWFQSASEQRGASLLARLHQERVRFGPTFGGPRFDPAGAVADLVTG